MTTTEKVCINCGTKKVLSDFYFNFKLGYSFAECKECNKRRRNLAYRNNRERDLYTKKIYATTVNGKDVINRATKRAAKKYPEKWRARAKLRYWVKRGKIAQLACEKCGNFLSEAHHEDYSKPLDVIWLCVKHHWEREGRAIQRE